MLKVTDEIEKWAEERNLENADPAKQILKLGEEFGELCESFVKNKPDLTKDAIGDMYVVLTILAMQLGTTMDECAELAYGEIMDRKGKIVNGVFVKEADLP